MLALGVCLFIILVAYYMVSRMLWPIIWMSMVDVCRVVPYGDSLMMIITNIGATNFIDLIFVPLMVILFVILIARSRFARSS